MGRVLAILVLGGVTLSASLAYAQRTLRVPLQYATIQAAVDAAGPGDTVLVAPGRYVEAVDMKSKSIVLRSERGASVTTIEHPSVFPSPLWTVEQGQRATRATVLDGFAVDGRPTPPWGGGTITSGGTIRNCVMQRGEYGIVVSGSGLIENNEVRYTHELGGIYHTGGNAEIRGNFVHNCSTADFPDRGGGITSIGAIVEHNLIVANTSDGCGGGIQALGGAILNNVVVGNQAWCAGGVHIEEPGTICEGNLIAGNFGWYSGGGLVVYAPNSATSIVSIRSNLIVGNWTNGDGGGLLVNPGHVELVNNTIVGNHAGGLGGGIDNQAGVLRIANTLLASNTAIGGGLNVSFSAGRLEIMNSLVPGGQAGIHVRTPAPITTLVWGAGNFDAAPRFVDPSALDFRLRADSPCVDRGGTTLPLGLVDFDGDPRVAGTAPDVGADEFFPSLRATPFTAGGGTVTLVGDAGRTAWLGIALRLGRPTPLPGTSGLFALHPGSLVVLPLGRTPVSGVLPTTLPGLPTPTTIYAQALVGTALSGPIRIDVR